MKCNIAVHVAVVANTSSHVSIVVRTQSHWRSSLVVSSPHSFPESQMYEGNKKNKKLLMFSYVLMSIRVLINKVLLQRSEFYPKIEMLVDILLLHILRNGPDKNDSNNGNEHVGMQKRC